MTSKEKVEKALYSYTAEANDLEEENRILRETVSELKTEIDKFRSPALMLAEVTDLVGERAIIKVPNGNRFLVEIGSSLKRLEAGETVLVEQKNLTIVDRVSTSRKFEVEQFIILEKPTVTWADIGGLETQKRDIMEVIELPLKRPDLFKEVGITPPKGILLHGPPGTGKTLLAKAVAASTHSTFIQVVGSELVQKFIGEGAKLVKEIFELARRKAPSIVFIDELDSVAARRIDLGTSGEREVQRTFMQLLAEIDGFKPLGNVKIIASTNRRDILDPAVLRPERLDRLIRVPTPDAQGLKDIFAIHTRRMKLANALNMERLYHLMKGFNGAEIKASCTEAGYFAIRQQRFTVTEEDFVDAIAKVKQEEALEGSDYLRMFG